MHAPPKSSEIEVLKDPATLEQYDAFLFGIPTRYGNFPAQWKAFWDSTGRQWQTGGYWGKYAGVFVSTGTVCSPSRRPVHHHKHLIWDIAWRRPRIHCHCGYEHSSSPRHHLRATWLQDNFRFAGELGRSPRRLALGCWYFFCKHIRCP